MRPKLIPVGEGRYVEQRNGTIGPNAEHWDRDLNHLEFEVLPSPKLELSSEQSSNHADGGYRAELVAWATFHGELFLLDESEESSVGKKDPEIKFTFIRSVGTDQPTLGRDHSHSGTLRKEDPPWWSCDVEVPATIFDVMVSVFHKNACARLVISADVIGSPWSKFSLRPSYCIDQFAATQFVRIGIEAQSPTRIYPYELRAEPTGYLAKFYNWIGITPPRTETEAWLARIFVCLLLLLLSMIIIILK